jgi:4-oxalocrotonate tautomerase
MPEIIVHCVEGRTPEQKKALCADITAAVTKHFGAPADAVTVSIVEARREFEDEGRGDVLGAVSSSGALSSAPLRPCR